MSNENHSGQGPFLTARELAPYALARLVEEKQAGRLNYVHACLIPDRWDEVGVTVFLRPDWNIQAVTAIVEPICTDDFGIAWAPIAVVPEFCLSGEPTAPVITNDVCRRILELRARVREEEGDPLALVLPGLWAIVRSGFEQTVLQIGFRIELSGEDQIKFAWQLASTLKEPFKLYIGGFNMDVSWERKPALVENQIDRPNPSLLDILVRAGTVLRTLTEECLAYGDDPDNHPLPQETRVCEEGAADLNIAPGSIVITRPNLTVVFQPQATETEPQATETEGTTESPTGYAD